MNLRDLHYFIKVAEFEHFGRAAAASFVSQPTLSMQLKKLEAELNVILFHRDGKKVRLTEAGHLLLPKALHLIESAQEIKSIAKTLQNPFYLPVRLGVIPTIAPYLMPLILPALTKKLPELNLILIEEKTQTLLNQLEKNQIDLAFVALPIQHHFNESILYEEPFVVALPKNHALAVKQQISLQDLATENLLMLEEGHCLRDHALQFCDHFDGKQEIYRASSLETLCQMVALGHGLTLLPQWAAQNRPQLVIRPFQSPSPSRKIGLLWKAHSPRLQALIQIRTEMDKILKII